MKIRRELFTVKKINRNSLFVKYIAFLLAMLVIPMMLGVAVLSLSTNAMLEQAKENSYKEVQQAQKEFDGTMEKIRAAAVSLATDAEISEFQYDVNDKQSIFDLNELIKKLRSQLQEMNGVVLGTYISYQQTDLFLGVDGRFFGGDVYQTYFQYQDMDYEAWRAFVDQRYYDALIPQTKVTFQDARGTRDVLTYIQSFPVSGAGEIKGNIVILLDAEKLGEKFSRFQTPETSLAVVGENNQTVFQTGNADYWNSDWLLLEEGYSEQRAGREKVLVSSYQGTGDYKFISVQSAKQIYAAAQDAKLVLFCYVAGILLLGIGLLAVVIYKGILPVKKMLLSIGKGLSRNDMDVADGNELEYLAACFNRLKNEKQNVEEIVAQQKPAMQRSLISDLIHDEPAGGEAFSKACKAAGLEFVYEGYLVALYELAAEKRDEELENAMLVKYAVSNIVEELFSDGARAFVVDTGWRECAVLVNFDPRKISYETVTEHFKLLKKVIDEQLEENMQISMGAPYRDVKKASLSYEEAKRAAAYQMLVGADGVVKYEDIKNSGQNYHYHYSLEQENALINAVMLGDSERASERLEQILQLNHDLSFDVMQLLFFDLMCTAFRVLNQQEYDLGLIFEGEEPYRRIMDCRSFGELKETILRILEKICRYVSQNRSDKKEAVKTDMLRYIDIHLADVNLSMETVADAFSLNYTYVSHFFKDYVGENFSSYLTKRKIGKAKDYLRETDLKVEAIANQLGYANSTVLSRNFKKVTGMTPGQYRDTQAGK